MESLRIQHGEDSTWTTRFVWNLTQLQASVMVHWEIRYGSKTWWGFVSFLMKKETHSTQPPVLFHFPSYTLNIEMNIYQAELFPKLWYHGSWTEKGAVHLHMSPKRDPVSQAVPTVAITLLTYPKIYPPFRLQKAMPFPSSPRATFLVTQGL